MNGFRLLVFLCSAVFAAGCAGNAGEYVLTGKFENAAASYAMIKCGKTVEDMDTIRLSADGSFRYVRKLEKPAISFMMVSETGFFSVIMINGTRNHIEADLSRVGDCRITGDLADAHRLYAELQREMKEKTGQDYASFKEAELTFADFRLRAEKRLADIPDTTFRSLALRELDASAFLTLFTWLGRLQDAGLPVSSDPDYNRFMQECDVDNPGYMANGLIDYYFSWCCQCRQENGGKDAWQYTLSLVAGKIADLQIREKVYMNILTEFFAGEDADGEAEAVFTRGMDLLREAENQEALRKQYGIFKKLRPGADAVECELEDITGKVFKFSDLQGKAVYLDVWATWCGPCCEEIPYMEKVAEYFRNDPRIEIVSISVDANRKAWETKLEKDKPEWKQFLLKNFCDLYNINGIPRFMMFDKKGRIITVDAPRPSDPEIIGFIESHLK